MSFSTFFFTGWWGQVVVLKFGAADAHILSSCQFPDNWHSKTHTWGHKRMFVCTFKCPISVKFHVGDFLYSTPIHTSYSTTQPHVQ